MAGLPLWGVLRQPLTPCQNTHFYCLPWDLCQYSHSFLLVMNGKYWLLWFLLCSSHLPRSRFILPPCRLQALCHICPLHWPTVSLQVVFITEEEKKYPLLKKCFQTDSQRIKKITPPCWNTGCSERWLHGLAASCVKQGPGGRFHSVKSMLTLCLGVHVKPNSRFPCLLVFGI